MGSDTNEPVQLTAPTQNPSEGDMSSAPLFFGNNPFHVKEYLRESSAKTEDDGYSLSAAMGGDNVIIEPPFDYDKLISTAMDSSSLDPCISAMEVNVEATGYDIVSTTGMEASDLKDNTTYLHLVELFREPYPNTTMIGLRKRLRRDLEILGNAYIEVLENSQGVPVFLKYLNAKKVRLVKYSAVDSVPTKMELNRKGIVREVTLTKQERRYVYKAGSTVTYLAEMGCSRDLHKDTGVWASKGNRLPVASRSSKVIHLKAKETPDSVYALPRWISQVRSVCGESEAESLNLTYFRNGGIPPVMIFLQNGKLTEASRTQLNAALSGKAADKQQGVILETISTSGTLDKAGTVNVKVERFGSDRQSDSMFSNYTSDCYVKIKSSYRIPQLFLGRTDDYNYATAYAAIVVGEAQVFKPERDEFDDIINNQIVRRFSDEFEFQSKPLVAVDVAIQQSILKMTLDSGAISNEELVKQSNKLSNLNLTWNTKEPAENAEQMASLLQRLMPSQNPTVVTEEDEVDATQSAAKREHAIKGFDTTKVSALASRWAEALSQKSELTEDDIAPLRTQLGDLSVAESNLFDYYLAEAMLPEGAPLTEAIVNVNAIASKLMMG